MILIGFFNFGWFSLKNIPETPPGYYENIVLEHTQLLINFRDEYQKQRETMTKELTSRKHTVLETAQITLKLNIAESRYLDFWLAEKPIVVGMLKPFEESKYVSWYASLQPDTRKDLKETAEKLYAASSKLAECHQNTFKNYQSLVSGLSAPSDDKLSDTMIAQTQVILRNLSHSENSTSEICDNAMMSYFSSVQRLSKIYSVLADTYQEYSEDNEDFRKLASGLLTFMLMLVCYRCRVNIIKKAAQSIGG